MQGDPTHPGGPEGLAGLRAGDPQAVDRWFRAEHPRVWRLCLGFLGAAEEAEDAAQEALLKLHDHIDAWDPERPYGPWRNALVLNVCRDRLRRREVRARAEEQAAAERELEAEVSPSADLEQGELRDRITRALALLSEREREAFVLRELEGEATAGVALAMKISESSVRSLLTLARRRLREHLAGERQELLGGGDA